MFVLSKEGASLTATMLWYVEETNGGAIFCSGGIPALTVNGGVLASLVSWCCMVIMSSVLAPHH